MNYQDFQAKRAAEIEALRAGRNKQDDDKRKEQRDKEEKV
jgi:hypothetical protein